MRPGVRSPPRPPLQPGAGNGLHQVRAGCQQRHAGTATRLRLSRDLASIFCLFLAGDFAAILRNCVPRHSRGDVGVGKREWKVGVHGAHRKRGAQTRHVRMVLPREMECRHGSVPMANQRAGPAKIDRNANCAQDAPSASPTTAL